YFERLIDGEIVTPEFERIREDRDVSSLNRNCNANVGMEYFINDKSYITGSLFYRYGEDADTSLNYSDRFNEGSIVEQTLRDERQTDDGSNYQFSLNYVNRFDDNGQELTVDFQYENGSEDQFTNISE